MNWATVNAQVKDMALFIESGKVWGVPRGGTIIAGLLQRYPGIIAVDSPEIADYIIDDIIDSGATEGKYSSLNKPFIALIDKRQWTDKKWVEFPWEEAGEIDIEDNIRRLIEFLGEDPGRGGLKDTPRRVVSAYKEMTQGYKVNIDEILTVTFDSNCDEMIVVKDIPFVSLCEHHMMPFWGSCSVGYIPADGRVVGLSKIPRLINALSQRLQIQERLTEQIAKQIQTTLCPIGVGVLVRAHHSCMWFRGVKSGGEMKTAYLTGAIKEDSKARAEFLNYV